MPLPTNRARKINTPSNRPRRPSMRPINYEAAIAQLRIDYWRYRLAVARGEIRYAADVG
jgi:hypothetical protein